MISKQEFLDRVRTDVFPLIDANEWQRRKKKSNIFLTLWFIFMGPIIIAFCIVSDFSGESFKTFISLLSIVFLGLLGIKMPLWNWEEEVIDKAFKKNFAVDSFKNVLLKMLGQNPETVDDYKSSFFTPENIKLLQQINVFEKKLKRKYDYWGDEEIYFDELEVNAYKCGIEIPRGRNSTTLFHGMIIQTPLRDYYKEPILFIKRKIFNRRKDIGELLPHRVDKNFRVYSNNYQDAQRLYYSGVPQKLLNVPSIFKLEKVEAAVFQDKMYIFWYVKKDFFEARVGHFLDIKQYERFYEDFVALQEYCAQFRDL